jgi:hypothetical protein
MNSPIHRRNDPLALSSSQFFDDMRIVMERRATPESFDELLSQAQVLIT